MKLVLALSLGSAAALVAPATQTASKAVAFASALDGMAGGVEKGDPMPGTGTWDPLSLGELHSLVAGSEHAGVMPSPQWLREAEIKHGRVAMLAFTGALVQSYGMHFPGSLNGEYYEAGVNPFEATPSAFATCPTGMGQILLFIGLTEGYTFPEGAWGGTMTRDAGDLGYRWDWAGKGAENLEAQKMKELKNGRAAMLGIMAFSAAHFIPGSVPFFFNA